MISKKTSSTYANPELKKVKLLNALHGIDEGTLSFDTNAIIA